MGRKNKQRRNSVMLTSYDDDDVCSACRSLGWSDPMPVSGFEVLEITPKIKLVPNGPCTDKSNRCPPKPASSKARTKSLNRERMISQETKVGHFAVYAGDEEA